MRRPSRLALFTCALVVAGSAGAATRTGNLAVTATVTNSCLLTAETMDFGTYTPGNGFRNGMARIFVLCTDGMAYDVGLGAGLAVGATDTNRSMQNGPGLLSYGLFQNAQRNQNWGQSAAADRVADVGRGMLNDNRYTIYGRIPDSPSNRLVPAGIYSDTVHITITY